MKMTRSWKMPLYRHFSGSFAYYGVKDGIIMAWIPFGKSAGFVCFSEFFVISYNFFIKKA